MTVIYDERAELHGPYFNDDGRIVQSVTGIISKNLGWDKDKLYHWIARVTSEGYDYNNLTSIAAEVGTCTHQMVEAHLDPEMKPLDPAVWSPKVWEFAQQGLVAYLEWEDFYKPETMFTELKLVHEELNYGGTLDYGAIFQGKPALIDFKTSDAVRRGHIIQVSAYRELWRANLDDDPRVIVLRIPVTGEKAHMTDVTGSMDLAFKVYKKCLELADLKEEWEHGFDNKLGRLLA